MQTNDRQIARNFKLRIYYTTKNVVFNFDIIHGIFIEVNKYLKAHWNLKITQKSYDFQRGLWVQKAPFFGQPHHHRCHFPFNRCSREISRGDYQSSRLRLSGYRSHETISHSMSLIAHATSRDDESSSWRALSTTERHHVLVPYTGFRPLIKLHNFESEIRDYFVDFWRVEIFLEIYPSKRDLRGTNSTSVWKKNSFLHFSFLLYSYR